MIPTTKPDWALCPPASLLCKLASVVVHAQEGLDPKKGHPFDTTAFLGVLNDPEVQAWIAAMTKLGMAPVRR